MTMIPWYYGVATFALGGITMLVLVLGFGVFYTSGRASRAEEQRALDRRKHVRGRWTHPERREG